MANDIIDINEDGKEMRLFIVHAATKRGAAIHLTFNDEERARSAQMLLGSMRPAESVDERRGLTSAMPWNPIADVEDDYGSRVSIDRTEIAIAGMDDLAKNANGESEKALFNARAQAKLQKRAQMDPMLRQPAAPLVPVAADLMNSGGIIGRRN